MADGACPTCGGWLTELTGDHVDAAGAAGELGPLSAPPFFRCTGCGRIVVQHDEKLLHPTTMYLVVVVWKDGKTWELPGVGCLFDGAHLVVLSGMGRDITDGVRIPVDKVVSVSIRPDSRHTAIS